MSKKGDPKPTTHNAAFRLERIDIAICQVPVVTPVSTSFGTMSKRSAIFLRAVDASGATGYGEIWCNFPSCGATHRVTLFVTEIMPRAVGRGFNSTRDLFDALTVETHRLALQAGELGPFAQCIAGLDVAIWDMLGRREHQPVYRLLGGHNPRVPVYASGINPVGVADTVAQLKEEGHTQFKLKVGFDSKTDLENARIVREAVDKDGRMMVDANQAWTAAEAQKNIKLFAEVNPFWVEEPMPVDTDDSAWLTLQTETGQRLAGGENLIGQAAFDAAMNQPWLQVMQPDICKWGGITGCFDVMETAKAAGKLTCPHSLGGGVALAGSAHLWAGVMGAGVVEVDGNPNSLRQDVYPMTVKGGQIDLGNAHGLGVDTDALNSLF